MARVIIRPTNRLLWVKQEPPPYVRGKVEKIGGWIIDHEHKTITADPNWDGARQRTGDLARVMMELDRLETFPENIAYVCESPLDAENP